MKTDRLRVLTAGRGHRGAYASALRIELSRHDGELMAADSVAQLKFLESKGMKPAAVVRVGKHPEDDELIAHCKEQGYKIVIADEKPASEVIAALAPKPKAKKAPDPVPDSEAKKSPERA